MTSEYLSSDFSYKKYSLEHLENWINDALNCEDLTPQDIYDTIVKCVDDNIEYHKKNLTKNIEVLSLLKGNRPSFEIDTSLDDCMPEWGHSDMEALKYTEEELDAMCDAAAKQEEKDKCREYNLREAEYYNKRAQLDAEHGKSKYYYDIGRNRSYDEMVADGWEMTDDGFWIKQK